VARPTAAVTPGILAIETTGEAGSDSGCRENSVSCLGRYPPGPGSRVPLLPKGEDRAGDRAE